MRCATTITSMSSGCFLNGIIMDIFKKQSKSEDTEVDIQQARMKEVANTKDNSDEAKIEGK